MMILIAIFAGALVWLFFIGAPLFGILWLGYYMLSLRLKRQERARFFFDLIETGLVTGRRVEDTIISVGRSGDRTMGLHFHLLAAYLEKGLTLNEAMNKVPRLLPAQAMRMLRVGSQIGDIGRVLPACRQLAKDAVSQTRGGINYLLALAFVGFPFNIFIFGVVEIYVLPQFASVCAGMDVPSSAGFYWLFGHRDLLLLSQVLLVLLAWSAAILYIGGPALFFWTDKGLRPLTHRIVYALPWRRKRLQRDFSMMLAILIDANVPEAEAVTMTADCTSNIIFQQRARRAVDALQQGVRLPEAVALVDDTGEFHWRLKTALLGGGGFVKAIRGWIESLDAKAYQLEQATAQTATTGMVLLNGLVVGVIVVSIFSVLISIINQGVLW